MSEQILEQENSIERPAARGRDLILEACPKRVRVEFADLIVADSVHVRLLHERGHLPVYYFPLADISDDALVESELSTHCPRKGEARYWSLRVEGRSAQDALWNYPEPVAGCPDISDLAAFYWDRVDAWFEEGEQVFVHPRDPYTRIDVLESSRHVEIRAGGVTLAESRRPVLLFESGLPVRYYLPRLGVRLDRLRPTATRTACPYKGITAGYWSAQLEGASLDDVAWCYDHPRPEVAGIAGRIAFYDERVELYVDGELQERP